MDLEEQGLISDIGLLVVSGDLTTKAETPIPTSPGVISETLMDEISRL